MPVYYFVNHIISLLDTESREQTNRKLAAAAILRRLDAKDRDESNEDGKRLRKEDLVLTQYEQAIALDVVAPEDIPVSFEGRFLSRLAG